ncbi:DUF4198 domain-containing protein [uncultured Jannaschia sp.]|uniref:DUF4198 domain-containing protein n=1 Tax=uncultured Jannaschia sp. TaxID=293347 RepID=UPI002621B640|nr:DUF4198 domain-containing protein [uncultured Jannaschia sp.]
MPIRPLVAFAALFILCTPLQAHEFWIEPLEFAVAPGDPVTARFHNGQEFAGSTLSFIPNRSARFDMISGEDVSPVPARIGDNPAVQLDTAPEGLLILVHETADMSLVYSEWEKFVAFAEHKAFTPLLAEHDARGLPRKGFREAYRRFAKSLVAVGDGAGSDRAVGLRTEIVAGMNPYTDDLSGGLPVQVLFEGAPRPGAQVEMFERAPDGGVAITLHTADAEGRAVLPMKAGHDYLLDSVAVLPLEPEAETDPVWLTLWAALTFAVPGA